VLEIIQQRLAVKLGLLVTEAVRREAGDVEGIEFTALDAMRVKGKTEPVAVYRAARGPLKGSATAPAAAAPGTRLDRAD
jgi:class 3 adenylate cyclase